MRKFLAFSIIVLALTASADARPRLLHRLFPRLGPTTAKAVVKILLAVSRLLIDHPRIQELDLNPVIASGKKALAVDALLIVLQGVTRGGGRQETQ